MRILVFVLLTLIAAPAIAQTGQIEPQLGLDTTGDCRRVTVDDPNKTGTDKTVPIGCLNTSSVYEIRDIKDLRGADVDFYQAQPSAGADIRRGTLVDPVSTPGALVKISKVESFASTEPLGGDPNNLAANAAFQVGVQGLPGSRSQSTAIYAHTTASPVGTDAIGISGWARVTGTSAAHAYGGYFEGRSDSPNGGTGGIEARSKNASGTTPPTQQVAASPYMGVWVSSSDGPSNVGVGVGSGDITNGFDIGFQATSGGLYQDSAFVAEGLGAGLGKSSAYKARGSHAVGINFQDASFTGLAILLPDGRSRTNGIRFGAAEYVWQDATTDLGDATSGLQIGSTGRVGFGVPSVPRPTLPPAAVSMDGIYMLLNQMRTALIRNGLACCEAP
jgi:hypothetical protein